MPGTTQGATVRRHEARAGGSPMCIVGASACSTAGTALSQPCRQSSDDSAESQPEKHHLRASDHMRFSNTAASASDSARPGTLHYVQTTAPEALAPEVAVLLGQLCLVLDKRDAVFAAMEAGGGLMVPAPTNAPPMPDQHHAVWRKLRAKRRRLAAQLWLSPSERSRLPPRPKPRMPDDEWTLSAGSLTSGVPSRWPGHHSSGCSRAVPTCPHHLRCGGDGEKPSFSGLSPVSPLSPPESRNHSADPLAKGTPVDQAPSA